MSTSKSSKKQFEKRPHGTGHVFERNGAVHVKFRPVPGKPPVQRKICRIGEMNKTQIEKRRQEIENEFKPRVEGIPTVSEVGKMLIKQLELDGKAKSYTRNRERTLRNHIEPELGDRPVNEPMPKDIRRWKRTRQQAGVGQATVLTAFWMLSGIFRYARGEEWRSDNPCEDVETPEYEHNHKIVHMTPAEVNKIIAAIPDDDWGKVERPLYRGGQKTGQRRSELLALRWEDCKFPLSSFFISEGYVEGQFKKNKSRKTRIVPMVPDYQAELEQWRTETRWNRDEDLVFADPVTGGPLEPGKVTKRFNKALLNAGVGPTEMRDYRNNGRVYRRRHPLWEFRDLRDTAATTMMADPNISPREVQEILGHANLATTSERYGGFLPSTDLAERMGKAFGDESVAEGEPEIVGSAQAESVSIS